MFRVRAPCRHSGHYIGCSTIICRSALEQKAGCYRRRTCVPDAGVEVNYWKLPAQHLKLHFGAEVLTAPIVRERGDADNSLPIATGGTTRHGTVSYSVDSVSSMRFIRAMRCRLGGEACVAQEIKLALFRATQHGLRSRPMRPPSAR